MKTNVRRRGKRGKLRAWLRLEPLEARHLLAANPIISEIVADNDDSLFDGDGLPSDWIELYNDGDESINLEGWHLTDDPGDPSRWTFPAVDLNAGQYIVVFASGHVGGDYVDPAGNLHTGFRLSSDGEYLALVRPDLTVAWEYADTYPAIRQDVSYGPAMQTSTEILIASGDIARTLIPTADVGNDWTGGSEAFDDSLWTDGAGNSTGVGYSIAQENTPGLVAEWTFETRGGMPVTDGQLAVGLVDETAGDPQGPYAGSATGDPSAGSAGLTYSDDTPEGIGSSYSLVFPAPENAANHVRIPIAADDGLATMTRGDFRVEAWFRTTDSGRNILTGSYVGAATSLNLELHTSNRGRIYVQGPNSTTDLNLTLPTNSRDGNWHHLAGVRNGSTVELYYDGTLVGSTPDAAGDFVINKPEVFIGRDSRTVSVVFNGSLDNVRFYNSADTSSLVAAYDFESAAGNPVTDGQDAGGQVDDTGGAGGFQQGEGFSASGNADGPGINYSADVAAVLTDSAFAMEVEEANPRVESVSIGMPPAIANLTLGDFTLQTWFRSMDVGRSILMGSYTGSDSALNFELHTDNRLRIYIQNTGSGTTDLNVSVGTIGNSRDGQWHFATAVRRDTSVELYFDGVLVGQTSDTAGSYVQTANNFYFGRDSRTAGTRFDGSLDNIRLWDVALTGEQIADMATGATPSDVTGGAFDRLVGTNVEAEMHGHNTSAWVRVPFEVNDPQTFTQLRLRMKYDDGFVAYLNGHEVARRNAPDPIQWNSAAAADRQVIDAKQFEDLAIGAPGQLLRSGTNILAIHGLNSDIGAADFLILPELVGVTTTVDSNTLRFFPQPTPGGPNGQGVLGFVFKTEFSVDRGVYEASDLSAAGVLEHGIQITTATPGATIRYTIDGSWPTVHHGIEFTDPIVIDTTTILRGAAFLDGFLASNTVTQTYLFLDDVIRQPSNPGYNDAGDPQYPLAFPRTHQPGVAADYEMDPVVVQAYADTIKDDLKSIPIMSLVMDMDDIFNQPNGIWSNSQAHGRQWERRTSVEYFDPHDPEGEFHINSAIRMQGRASRVPSSSIKHGFRLIFKDDFGPEGSEEPTGGPTKLTFPLFEDSDVDTFDTLILRAGYNYSYLHGSNDQNIRAQYLRDRFMHDTQLAMGQLSPHGSYVHLYINGLYFGLYAPQERPDASFMAQHLGGDKDDYDVISAGEVKDGTADAWNELLTRAAKNLSVSENYDAVLEMLDLDSLIDYMIVHIWGGTTDWPAPGGQFRNWVVGRKREEGAGFKFFVWDPEYSIQGTRDNRVNVSDANTPAFIYSQLRANPEFRLLFADRVQKHFFDDGALTPEANTARYSQLADEIDRAIVGESARWGDTRADACNPCLRDPLWVNERDWILNTYMPGRTETVLQQFARVDLYPSTAAPEFSQPDGSAAPGLELEIYSASSDLFLEKTLIALPTDAEIFIPTDDTLGTSWTERSFMPGAGWFEGTTGIGYERGTGYEELINTDVEAQMFNQHRSAFVRATFEYDTADPFDELQLRVQYDDGFVAYINGTEVARSRSVPAGPPSFDTSPTSHEGRSFEVYDIDLRKFPPDLLVDGTNVLSIHGMNRNVGDTDFLLLSELIGRTRDDTPSARPIWYTTDGSDPRLPDGNISPTAMQYEGAFALTENTQLLARVFLNDEWSALTEGMFVVEPYPLRITEINYHPADPTAQEQLAIPGVEGDDFEFIEIRNIDSDRPINLAGFTLFGGVTFTFPDMILSPGANVVMVENTAAFRERYGDETSILGQWSGRLSNGGEQLVLSDAAGNIILDFEYNDADPWPQRADGAGASLELIDPTATPIRESSKAYRWRSSVEWGGSPGRVGTDPVGVVINEILANTNGLATTSDSIELYNPTQRSIDISGWYLSDSSNDFLKFRIPDGTLLGAGDYVVFDERDFNPTPDEPDARNFALSGARGDDVWLVVPDGTGGVAQFVDDVHFAASLDGESLGRVPNGSGRLAAMRQLTLGAANATPRVGPVVISEVNYNPGDPSAEAVAQDPDLTSGSLEFVEVHNPTEAPVDLTDWRIEGGVEFAFASDTVLPAGASLVLISFDPDSQANANHLKAFRLHYGLDQDIRIIGGYSGQLSNGGEVVRLMRADVPPPDEPTLIPRMLEDEVLYDDLPPWPTEADGSGKSLERQSAAAFGNTAASWSAVEPTPGINNFSNGSGDFDGDGVIDASDIDSLFEQMRSLAPEMRFDLNADGLVNAADRDRLILGILGTSYGDANLDGVFDSSDLIMVLQTGEYEQQSPAKSGWAQGDWNGDGKFSSSDVVMAFQAGEYLSDTLHSRRPCSFTVESRIHHSRHRSDVERSSKKAVDAFSHTSRVFYRNFVPDYET